MSKLVEIQNELKAPKRQYNSFGGYNYRSAEDILEAIKPILKKYNASMVLNDEVVEIGGRVYIKATAILKISDESYQVSAYAREPEIKKKMDDSQITGTASSYARKYALNGLFLIDDTKDADTDEYQKRTTTTQRQANNTQRQTSEARDKLLELAKIKGITATEVARKYNLNSTSTDEEFKNALEQLKGA